MALKAGNSFWAFKRIDSVKTKNRVTLILMLSLPIWFLSRRKQNGLFKNNDCYPVSFNEIYLLVQILKIPFGWMGRIEQLKQFQLCLLKYRRLNLQRIKKCFDDPSTELC